MYRPLTELEEFTLQAWLSKPKQKRLLKNNGKLALVFTSTEIGPAIIARVRCDDGLESEQDITEYPL